MYLQSQMKMLGNQGSSPPPPHTLLSHFISSCSQIILSLFSSVSVDNGLKRNLEQRDVKGSIILQGKIIITADNVAKTQTL